MKASIKFRDEQKPLLRAKIPVNILGLPFQSGVAAGDAKDLSLSLGTFFDSGPSLKVSYRKNDGKGPISFIFKTGIGHFGSPTNSPLTMSAEFNLSGSQNPTFSVNFRPEFGNFSLRRSHSSSDFAGHSKEHLDGDPASPRYFNGEHGFLPSAVDSKAAARLFIGRVVKGTDLSARTAVPLLDIAVAKFRWGLRVPPLDDIGVVLMGAKRDPTRDMRLPLLVMNKIGIELAKDKPATKAEITAPATKYDRVLEAFFDVKKQIETVQAENGLLSQALNDLKTDIAAGKLELHRKKQSPERRPNYEKPSPTTEMTVLNA